MSAIFINYRTGDEESSAVLIERELSRRFGSDQVFRASKSIPLGADFTQALPAAVRKSEVLIAVIGSRWLGAVNEQGGTRLRDESDWTRREILEAFDHGMPVIPVLIGDTPRLRGSDLPPELATLADRQYYRLYHRSAEANLRTLGDELAARVSSLIDLDRPQKALAQDTDDGRGLMTMQAGDHSHQQTGGTSTFLYDPRGPVHTGTGNQFNGGNVNYVAGDNRGKVRQRFGPGHKRPDDER